LRVLGTVDRPALRRALDAVVSRHPALRTTFTVRDGEPVQVVRPHGYAVLRERDVPAESVADALVAAAREPFDLARGPLLRLDLVRHPDGEILLLAMHHIISDF